MTETSRTSSGALDALSARFRDNFSASTAVRAQHAESLSALAVTLPDAVLYVESTRDVADAAAICAAHNCPLVAYGAGTSVEGHILAVQGGVVLDFSRMNAVLEVSPEDLDCRVQPGVTREQLNHELRDKGLFFPIDPGANATLGGMAATGASGTTTMRYGSMLHNVMGLEVVLADGRVVRTGGRSRKSSAGYNLTKLLIGSEGTLGLFTELILKLHPVPQAVVAATCAFPSIRHAVNTAMQILQSGLTVARMELVDAASIVAINAYCHAGLVPGDYLFLEFHGGPQAVQEDAELAQEIALAQGGAAFQSASYTEDINKLWKYRHVAALAALAMVPNSWMLATDLVVPFSRLSDFIAESRRKIDAARLYAVIAGHVGDGSFHVGFVLARGDDEGLGKAHAVHAWMVRRAIELGGTCTGEHGIGIGKQEYLLLEHGSGVAVMRGIKQALDPRNILNPGKIFVAPESAARLPA